MTSPEFRRDAVPGRLCTCGHLLELHDISKKAQPCGPACTCTAFVLGSLRWRETRYVLEEIQP